MPAMKNLILVLLIFASSLAMASDKIVIVQNTDKYIVKYVVEQKVSNLFREGYNIKLAIYEQAKVDEDSSAPYQSKAIQYCGAYFTCGSAYNGMHCPDNTEEWRNTLDYIDFECFVSRNVSLEDIIPRKEKTKEEITKPFY